MRAAAECQLCLLNRNLTAVPKTVSPQQKAQYLRELFAILAAAPDHYCTPQLSKLVDACFARHFGTQLERDYDELKRVYNAKMLALEERLRERIRRSDDPLRCAVKLARVGNYIDFGTIAEIDDGLLRRLIDNADQEQLDEAEFARFSADLQTAAKLVYVTDNCGEIVLDKLLLEVMRARNPSAHFVLLARGKPAINDATVEDAIAVGLDKLLPVVGNGTDYPGTVLDELTPEAIRLLQTADMIVAKGQANFETMNGCGWNVYYLLLCKCDLFIRRFQKPRLTGLLVNERRVPPLR